MSGCAACGLLCSLLGREQGARGLAVMLTARTGRAGVRCPAGAFEGASMRPVCHGGAAVQACM